MKDQSDKATMSIAIERSLDGAYRYLTNLEHLTAWYDGWTDVVPATGLLTDRGFRFELHRERQLRREVARCTVRTPIAAWSFGWLETSGPGTPPVAVDFTLSELTPITCSVEYTRTIIRSRLDALAMLQ